MLNGSEPLRTPSNRVVWRLLLGAAECCAAHLQHIDFGGSGGDAPQRPVAGIREARLHVLRRQRQPHLQAREVPEAECRLAPTCNCIMMPLQLFTRCSLANCIEARL